MRRRLRNDPVWQVAVAVLIATALGLVVLSQWTWGTG